MRVHVPSLRTMLFLPLFFLAYGAQHICHRHLFALKKYSLPSHPLFRNIVCPHYTAECVIYLSFALLAAPEGHLVNRTLLTALFFVITVLGLTADDTRTFYAAKFGESAIRGRWRMIPGLF